MIADTRPPNAANQAGQLNLMCTLAVRGAFDRVVVPAFERGGHAVSIAWNPTGVLMDAIARGQRADATLLVAEAMDELERRGIVEPQTRLVVARSGLGVAVRAGATHPSVATADQLRQALLAARSVAYSRAGASGIYFGQLIERLGIAEAVNARATVIAAGFTAEKLLTGEADLAIQQLSELMTVDGIEIVGRFPDPLQTFITITAAVFKNAPNAARAQDFLRTLRTAEAVAAYRDSGLDPA